MSQENLVKCFVNVFGIPEEDVCDSLSYNTSSWDSVAHMALVAEIEETFDIMLDTDDILEMSDVAKIKSILGKYGVTFDAS